MVNRMPEILYGSPSSATSRSRTPSSRSPGGNESQSTHPTASARNDSRKAVNASNNARFGSSRETITPAGSGTENSCSDSVSGSARKMQRSSFRKTLMFQKSKRNNGSNATNSDTTKALLYGKTHNSECNSPASTANQRSKGLSANLFQSNRRSLRSRVSAAVVPSTVEEREVGGDTPTISQQNATCIVESSSSFSGTVRPQQQLLPRKQSPQDQITGKGEELPQGHVDSILQFYGGDNMSSASLDLYLDVLKVSPDASDREIRIAYFRRGREILGDNSGNTDQSYATTKANATKLDPVTKSRFQAVSMAYEILSTPTWKKTYLRQGGLMKKKSLETSNESNVKAPQNNKITTRSSEIDSFSSQPSTVVTSFPNTSGGSMQESESIIVSTTPKPKNNTGKGRQKQMGTPKILLTALRKSSFGPGQNGIRSPRRTRLSTQRSAPSVRWKDHVEELVFANHPNEHASDDDSDDSSEHDDILEEEELRINGQQSDRTKEGSRPTGTFSNPSFSGQSSSNGTQNANTNDDNGNSSRSRKRKKKKSKIVIDSDELESHLMRMDNEAEKHFVQDFWDNFEESMDGILSIVDSMGGGGDASKGELNKNYSNTSSTATPFFNASSWLSPACSINASPSQRDTLGTQGAAGVTIGRSFSHDLTIPVEDDINNEELLKRSNSFPLPSPSPSTLDAVSPSPLPPKFNRLGSAARSVVTPDEKGATSSKTASDSRVSSPYEMVFNAWPFQSNQSQQDENIEQENQQQTSPAVTSPVVVSPSPNSKLSKICVLNKGELLLNSTDLDTSLSVASSIMSTTQRRQKLFRPISPTPSEASDLITNDLVPVPSTSPSKINDGSGDLNANKDSDQFELDSRLSEMESLDLTELDNPFRRGGSCSSLTPAVVANSSLPTSSTSRGDVTDVLSSSSNSATKGRKMKKKNRFRVSMLSKIRGNSTEEVSHSHVPVQTVKSSMIGASSKSEQSIEDVFAGVEEDSQPPPQHGMTDGEELKVKDISIERSCSHMSDLSGSMFSSRNEIDNDGEASTSGRPASQPATGTLEAISIISSSTKKSLLKSTAGRSQASTGYSSLASSTRDDTNTVQSVETMGAEASGFFEYFTAYVNAVITECANLGASAGAAEYHQDFFGLFSNEASVHTAEIPEQPTSMC